MTRVEEQQAPVRAPDRGRLSGLDGLRGFAAVYVLLGHCWLLSYPGFPANHGPYWSGSLMFGHLAVVFFLVVSGFSLAVGPARAGWRLPGGVGLFARRRAWRILPPYWAALAFSLIVAWTIVPQPHSVSPPASTVAVYGLMLQDVAVAPTPNGAFWSIAVEAELYVVFPLLLLLRRRLGGLAMVALATLPVVALGLLVPRVASVSPVDKLSWLTPQLAPLFALGLAGAGVVVARERIRRLPWPWLAALAAVPVLAVVIGAGTVWTVRHYFWIDLAIAPALVMLLVAVSTGRPRGTGPAAGHRPGQGPRPVLLQPLPRAPADRGRGQPHAHRARPGAARAAAVPGHAGRGGAAVARVRPAVRRGVRDPVPALPRLAVPGRDPQVRSGSIGA